MIAPPPISYALIVDPSTVTRWHLAVIESMAEFAPPQCVSFTETSSFGDTSGGRRSGWRTAAVRRALGSSVVARPDDLGDSLGGVPTVAVDQLGAERTIDVVLDLTGCGVSMEVLGGGVERLWRFAPTRPDEPCLLVPLVLDQPLTEVELLERRHDAPGARVIAVARFPTSPHSYRRNTEHCLMGSVELARQRLGALAAGAQPAHDVGSPAGWTPARRVGDVRLGLLVVDLPRRWIVRQLHGLFQADRWHVGVVDRPIEALVDGGSLDDVQWLPRPPGQQRYVADPFGVVADDGDAVVLVEDYDHRDRHGDLAAYRRRGGTFAGPEPLRRFDVHASYPFLCRVGDEWWCIPETSAACEVRALRFDAATCELEDLGPLLENVALADPTLFEHGGRWWLLGTDVAMGSNTHLRAWWASDPRGPWEPHAIDPLVIDVAGARGAGTPFVVDGVLHRPAQDCTTGYGSAVSIRRIDELTPTSFVERERARLVPDPAGEYPDGLHTVSTFGDATLVDGVRREFAAGALRHELSTRAVLLGRRLRRR